MPDDGGKYLLEALITFGATALGVSVAIWADNSRESSRRKNAEKAHKENKRKLVFALLAEIKGIDNFCKDNEGPLAARSPYAFVTKVLESTTQEQIKFLNSLVLLNKLHDLRECCAGVHQTISAFTKPNINFGIKENNDWQKNWQEYKGELKKLIPDLQSKLQEEYGKNPPPPPQ